MPAATFLAPSRTIAWVRTVAVVVPSPHHLGAHVLELVLEFDLLGNRHTVLGGARRAEALVDDDVAALGAQRHLDGVGENVDTAQHALTGIGGKTDFFGSHVATPEF